MIRETWYDLGDVVHDSGKPYEGRLLISQLLYIQILKP